MLLRSLVSLVSFVRRILCDLSSSDFWDEKWNEATLAGPHSRACMNVHVVV